MYMNLKNEPSLYLHENEAAEKWKNIVECTRKYNRFRPFYMLKGLVHDWAM